MRSLVVRRFGLGAMVLALLATAPPAFAAAGKPFAGTQINVTLYSSVEGNAIRNLVETGKFQEETGIKVEVNMLSWENTRQKVLLAFSAKEASYDVILIDRPWVPEFAARRIITGLKQFLNNPQVGDPEYNIADFPKQMLDQVTYENDYFALPYTFNPTLLMYRKDLFENPKEKAAFKAKYGYDLVPPQTFQRLHDAAEFFSRKTGGQELYGITSALKRGGFAFNRWKQYAYAFGGSFFDAQGRPKVDKPENVNGLEFLVGLKGFMPPTVVEMTGGEGGVYFSSGKAAMTMDYSLYFPPSIDPQTSKIPGKVAFTVVPKGVVQETGNGGTVLSVYALSKQKEAAYKFIEWVCSVEGERLNVANMISPMRISVARDPEIQKRLPWTATELYSNMNIKYGDPVNRLFPSVIDITGEEVNAAFTGDKSAKQALTDAQARVERSIGK